MRSQLTLGKGDEYVATFEMALVDAFPNGVVEKFKLQAPVDTMELFAVCACMKITVYVWDATRIFEGRVRRADGGGELTGDGPTQSLSQEGCSCLTALVLRRRQPCC